MRWANDCSLWFQTNFLGRPEQLLRKCHRYLSSHRFSDRQISMTIFGSLPFLVSLFCGRCISAFCSQPSLIENIPIKSLPSSVLQMTMESTTTSPTLLLSLREKLGISEDSLAHLVLASQSPRRREILDMMGLANKYTVEPSPLDETNLQLILRSEKIKSTEYTRRLAESKAEELAKKYLEEEAQKVPTFYLGSDTIVEVDECILEKPKDTAEAKEMIRRLSGRQHHVHTGVAIYRLFKGQLDLVSSFTDTASVTFANLSDADIEAYVASGEPMDKAGTYVSHFF